MLIIRNGELIQTKGDRTPIGGRTDDDFTFTTHEEELKKGDSIYTFSDGFQDQFGGAHGKKFMLNNFKDLLISIYSMPMDEQKEKLHEAITGWMGTHEQLDDILVIGIRV